MKTFPSWQSSGFVQFLKRKDYAQACKIALLAAEELLTTPDDSIRWALWNDYFSELDKHYLAQYQSYDFEIVDYQMYSLVPGNILFRGPQPSLPRVAAGEYYVFCGAAQMFGRYHSRALHTIVAEAMDCETINLSIGGAGPENFMRDDFLHLINNSRGLVLQVFSGRSIGCDEYPLGRLTFRKDDESKTPVDRLKLLGEIWEDSRADAIRLVRKWNHNYIVKTRELISKIRVPITLLWLSDRTPESWYPEVLEQKCEFGTFPHLIGADLFQTLRALCADVVVVSEDPDVGHGFKSRITGQPCPFIWPEGWLGWKNQYYPSAYVAETAAPLVVEALRGQTRKPRSRVLSL